MGAEVVGMDQEQVEERRSFTLLASVVDMDLRVLRDPMELLVLLDSQGLVELVENQVILESQGMPESLDHLDPLDLLEGMETVARWECLECLGSQVAA